MQVRDAETGYPWGGVSRLSACSTLVVAWNEKTSYPPIGTPGVSPADNWIKQDFL